MSLKSRFGPILSQFKALMPGGASGANEDDFIAKLEATQAVIAQACQPPWYFRVLTGTQPTIALARRAARA
jgi:hypothetical protein